MSTNTTQVSNSDTPVEVLIVAYYSLGLIIVGTALNLITFLIFCRPRFLNKKRATFHYMRAMVIFDILMLYGWNLDHYLSTIEQVNILRLSIASCRFFSFLSYFAPQTSAWLRVFVCIDRYLSLSRLHRTWFNSSKHVLMIIACVLLIFMLLNFHFFLFVCYYRPSGTISALSWLYSIYPLWDYIHLAVYNCVPFILMVVFNSCVIYHLITLRRTTTIQNSRIQHRAISITLVITTFLFLLMTVPSTVAFAFFSSADATVLRLFDGLLYSYHVLSFPLYFITFAEFRRECLAIIRCKPNHQQVAPQTLNQHRSLNTTQQAYY